MAKSSRRVQANARTLSGAVRKLFRPALREIAVPPAATSTTTTTKTATKTLLPLEEDDENPVNDKTPDDQLISTQVEPPPTASTSTAVANTISTSTPSSAKSLGKRKRLENGNGDTDNDIEVDEGRSHVNGQSRTQREAPGIVYKNLTQRKVPPALKKYWHQRYRLFSRYDEGIEMDYDGWFSVTPENIAAQIAERCRCKTVVDAFCGVGGNAIQFAMTCERVIAIDNSPVRLACAKANAAIYGVEEYITFVEGDYLSWAEERAAKIASGQGSEEDKIDVVFMSPPWGGIDYQEDQENTQVASPVVAQSQGEGGHSVTRSAYSSYPLSRLLPRHGKELFEISRKLTKNIAYYLPRNLDIHEAAALADTGEKVEVEEEWMGSKLKALCLYYGDLAKQT